MQLDCYRSLWAATGPIEQVAEEAVAAGFAGLEGPVPREPAAHIAFTQALSRHGLALIGEVCTGGSGDAYWVPRRDADVAEHLRGLARDLALYADLPTAPVLVNIMGGLDAWSLDESLAFFDAALELAGRHGLKVAFETHRTRSLYSPWSTLRVLQARPHLPLTCDFSHWVVVAERLIDTEVEALDHAIANAEHIHARVGYPQGPQVPHPAAPEWQQVLAAHERWWSRIWRAQAERGYTTTTINPEFGPDGYLHCLPFTGAPVADLWQVTRWMRERLLRTHQSCMHAHSNTHPH